MEPRVIEYALQARTLDRVRMLKGIRVNRGRLKTSGSIHVFTVYFEPDSNPSNVDKIREAGIGWCWEIFLHHGDFIDFEVRILPKAEE